MIPEILKNFNLFIDGRGHAGKVLEVTPPKLTIKTEEFQVSVVTFFDGFLVKLFDGCDLANYTLPLFPSE